MLQRASPSASSLPPLHELLKILFDEDNCIHFLCDEGIFLPTVDCVKCNEPMELHLVARKYRCMRRSCRTSLSIRTRSFFSKSRLPCSKIMELAYLWLSKVPATSISAITGCSSKTICAFNAHFRQLVADSLDETDVKIGGSGVIVEVDETKLGKRKYNRGHRVEGVWVVGGIERTMERKVFLVQVENRSADTLLGIIERHVLPGSVVHTDLWRGYSALDDSFDYSHRTVNHSECFKDPNTGVHTNTIEGFWNGLKMQIKPRNRNKEEIEDHLFESIWRKKNSARLWISFLGALKDVSYE